MLQRLRDAAVRGCPRSARSDVPYPFILREASGSISGMKKAKTSPPKTVDEYLAGVPEPARSAMNKIRAVIRSAAPAEATETISYRMPAFKYNGVLVWFG